MVNSDSVTEKAGDFFAVGRAEVGFDEGVGDFFFFFFGAKILGEEVLGGVGGGELCEVNEVDGGAVCFGEFTNFFFESGGGVFEFEGNGALLRLDESGGGSG